MKRKHAVVVSSVLALASVAFFSHARPARADTVANEAAKGACSTGGVVGLSDQLVKIQMCLSPGTFVTFTPHANVTLTSASIHPYLLASARDALWNASKSLDLQVNSAFRTIADQYVLYYSGGCALAAKPGNSNHETGKAVDLENWSAATSAMEASGCTHTYPSTDPVHFDCPGGDHRADSITAFQRLWNLNNPGDKIAEDGSYGPATESRLAKSPAGGFPIGDCTPPVVTPDYRAEFVSQSFPPATGPTAGVLTMHPGDDVNGFIELKNTGGKAWDGKTFLATTEPRDRASDFAASSWPAKNRAAGVGGVVSPGGTHKFMFTLHAPAKVGTYDEHFGVVEEGVAWFSDPGEGGPDDKLLQVKIVVVEPGADAGPSDGSVRDAGDDATPTDDATPSDAAKIDDADAGDDGGIAGDAASGGCACSTRTSTSAPTLAWAMPLALLLALGRRRRSRESTHRVLLPRAKTGYLAKAMHAYAIGSCRLELALGDITRETTDAIGNAANALLMGGGGVDGAIHRAAGPALLEACRALKKTLPGGVLRTGGAVMTAGFSLKAKHVVHCVGPIFAREGGEAPALLGSCYREALALVRKEGLSSIAFPSIATGVYGYPVRAAADVALEAIHTDLMEFRAPSLVRFALFDESTLAAYVDAAGARGLIEVEASVTGS